MLDRTARETEPLPNTRPERVVRQRGTTGADDMAIPGGAAIVAILRRRKWLLLATMLICPLLAYSAISHLTPRYTASGTLQYDPSEYKARELQSILRVDPITDAVMATQAEVLRGMPVVEQVAARLNLFANPEFNPSLRGPSWLGRAKAWLKHALSGADPTPPADRVGPTLEPGRNATLAAVRASLIVTPVKASRVLEVAFTAQDPLIAAAGVNNAMDFYVKSQLGAKYGAVNKARELLLRRAEELRRAVLHQEGEIARYRADHGLVEGMHARLESEQISLLTSDLVRARNDLAAAEGRLDAASGRAGAAAQAAIATSVVQLRARRDQVSSQLQSMMGRLGGSHPDVQSLRAQLADIDRTVAGEAGRVVAAIDADVRAARDHVASLQRNLSEAQRQVGRDAQAQVALNAQLRDGEASRGLLQAVLERIQQMAQQPSIETPDAHEISLALPPEQPSFPRTGPWMAAAAALGIVLGLLLVYLRELSDSTFRCSEDVRAALGLRCLALIPRLSRRELKGLTVAEYAARKPRSALAEQLRALRAGLSLWPDRPRLIAITAARQQEGKTTVTQALGRLAAMNGERVIVLDCDIRKRSPGRLPAPAGLVDCLQERASLADIIRKDPATGMDSITSGTSEANILGLLMSPTMAQLLLTLRQEYDLVLLDTPPAEAITDARVVAGLADATLLCVRWCGTSRQVALHALELLEQAHANIVGVALTQVDVNVHVRSGYADAQVYHPRYGGYFRE
ncbi:MAG: AAA family ATPase [Acetobacteraceae bacterium]